MIEFLVLFLGVYGALAAPHAPHVSHDPHLDNNAKVVDGQLPTTEKEVPITHLPIFTYLPTVVTETYNLPTRNNLAERSQVHQRLPGTENLAEKRIPDIILKRLQERRA